MPRAPAPRVAIARSVSSSVLPGRTFGQTGSSGLRVSAITAQRRAIASVLSQASGRSANSARIAAAGLNQCSGVTRRRSRSRQRPSLGDAQQRVMRLVHLGRGEEALVGRDQRQPARVGQRDQPRLDRALDRAARAGAVPSRRGPETPPPSARSSRSASACCPSASSRAIGPRVPPVSRSSPSACASSVSSETAASARIGVQEAERGQALQIGEPGRVLRQQHHRVGRQARVVAARASAIWQPMIGCTPLRRAGLAELQRAEQVAGVGDRHRRHRRLARERGDLVRLDRAFAQRIGGMDAQMDEIGVRHPVPRTRSPVAGRTPTSTSSGQHDRSDAPSTGWTAEAALPSGRVDDIEQGQTTRTPCGNVQRRSAWRSRRHRDRRAGTTAAQNRRARTCSHLGSADSVSSAEQLICARYAAPSRAVPQVAFAPERDADAAADSDAEPCQVCRTQRPMRNVVVAVARGGESAAPSAAAACAPRRRSARSRSAAAWYGCVALAIDQPPRAQRPMRGSRLGGWTASVGAAAHRRRASRLAIGVRCIRAARPGRRAA